MYLVLVAWGSIADFLVFSCCSFVARVFGAVIVDLVCCIIVLTLDLFGMFLDDQEISTGVGDTNKLHIFLLV